MIWRFVAIVLRCYSVYSTYCKESQISPNSKSARILNSIAVGCATDALVSEARVCAEALKLEFNNQVFPQLCLTEDKWVLLIQGCSPLYVDFDVPSRMRHHEIKQGLIRACKPRPGMHIIDAMAGWGRDAALLAHYGAQVLMLERNPVMGVLLSDGLDRCTAYSSLSLHIGDALLYLEQLSKSDYPDVIYLDPMHPVRQKSALVKKDMQALQRFIAPNEDVLALLELSLMRARQHVVLKWPQNHPSFMKPTSSIEGKTIRFDVYYAG